MDVTCVYTWVCIYMYDIFIHRFIFAQMDTSFHMDRKILISPYRYEYERIKVRSAGAHPRWSSPCAHCCALDSPAASLRSWLRSTRGIARRRPAPPRQTCCCRRAHVTLHGTGCPRAHAQRPGVLCVRSLCMQGGSAAGYNAIVRLWMPRTACRFRR